MWGSPITRSGRPIGLVTLDDLVLDGGTGLSDVRAVIAAQLEQPARLKPAGSIRPGSLHAVASRPPTNEPPDSRRQDPADAAYHALLREASEPIALVGTADRAASAVASVLECLSRRIGAEDALRLAACFPERVRAAIELTTEGPDNAVTLDTIAERLGERLGLLPAATLDVVLAVCSAVRASHAAEAGAIAAQLQGQLKAMCPLGAEK